ncbi:caspase domain-containing protein [Armillaria mellea]|nr:caspase domain-containing protein [Armillaria mellea]
MSVYHSCWPLPNPADGLAGGKTSSFKSPLQCIPIEDSIPPLFALVIGIDKYENRSYRLRELNGAVADVDAVYIYLHETLHVPENRIKNLRNEEGTRATIEMEIRNLGDNTAIKEGDPILIYYAGHGTEANAPPGWPSVNGKIQMLVPHDFIPGGTPEKKSDNITVILDCCHSASGTRATSHDLTFAVRGINLPEDRAIPQDLLHDKAWAIVAAKGYEKTGLISHVLLSACKHGQEASEKDGHGAFTAALLSLLRERGGGKLTCKDVITSLPGLHTRDPQCEDVHNLDTCSVPKYSAHNHNTNIIRASSGTPGQYILEAGEAIERRVRCLHRQCDDIDETPFRLARAGYALQTRVGEDQDVRLFVEKNEILLGVFKQIADEMQAEKRGFRLVKSRNDKPDLVVTAYGETVHFEVMDKHCRQYGLTRMPFGADINDSGALRRILQSSAHFYWHFRRPSQRVLAGAIRLECLKLKETSKRAGLELNGENLINVDNAIVVDDDEDVKYGFKITGLGSEIDVPLYVSMFYFDSSDLSIVSFYEPGCAKDGVVDVSLPPRESLTIGYRGTPPASFMPREGQGVAVGSLKLFFSTKYMDLSGIVQSSPFTECRESFTVQEEISDVWDTMCITVVQKTEWVLMPLAFNTTVSMDNM